MRRAAGRAVSVSRSGLAPDDAPISRHGGVHLGPTSQPGSVYLSPTSQHGGVHLGPTSQYGGVHLGPTSQHGGVHLGPTSHLGGVYFGPQSLLHARLVRPAEQGGLSAGALAGSAKREPAGPQGSFTLEGAFEKRFRNEARLRVNRLQSANAVFALPQSHK